MGTLISDFEAVLALAIQSRSSSIKSLLTDPAKNNKEDISFHRIGVPVRSTGHFYWQKSGLKRSLSVGSDQGSIVFFSSGLVAGCTWRETLGTCVFQSDFGFVLNCAFKKSGLFRVRNLGGVKGYVGLGFSVGDELGFAQSLSNLEANKRRSVQTGRGGVPSYTNTATNRDEVRQHAQNTRQVVPPFKPLPPGAARPIAQQPERQKLTPQMIAVAASIPGKLPNIVAAIPPVGSIIEPDPSSKSGSPSDSLPPFISMPQSLSQLTDRISNSPVILEDSDNEVSKDDFNQLPLPGDEVASSVNEMTLLSLHPMSAEPSQSQQQTEKRQSLPSSLPSLAPIQGMETSLKALAEASNITLEALEAAILLRQQQLLRKQQGPTSTSTTTTTTMSPHKNKYNPGATKVMNAPREYYPMGYDKNFDDNFASRVDLPDTSFYCGDQKHFPGLYADEDLGCMVFHVCALTDDGLIMKSFLCPESTLFDQTILKCNWWFYVDCKASKSLYDSNIPISKSYQLMKALAFFSAYKNHDNSTTAQENSETLE
ncbi:hypothetical protein WN48_01423 [Eufriesea mexicana]|uniref:Chitin-binding type-2 domain-containing protein n=1 Tax=Eufriesea mexicana TaxID=516756 RepID=A0A310S886_9HYME|nr:hypothetical protein WN48_01423 [Eufriesea mexicana]